MRLALDARAARSATRPRSPAPAGTRRGPRASSSFPPACGAPSARRGSPKAAISQLADADRRPRDRVQRAVRARGRAAARAGRRARTCSAPSAALIVAELRRQRAGLPRGARAARASRRRSRAAILADEIRRAQIERTDPRPASDGGRDRDVLRVVPGHARAPVTADPAPLVARRHDEGLRRSTPSRRAASSACPRARTTNAPNDRGRLHGAAMGEAQPLGTMPLSRRRARRSAPR